MGVRSSMMSPQKQKRTANTHVRQRKLLVKVCSRLKFKLEFSLFTQIS